MSYSYFPPNYDVYGWRFPDNHNLLDSAIAGQVAKVAHNLDDQIPLYIKKQLATPQWISSDIPIYNISSPTTNSPILSSYREDLRDQTKYLLDQFTKDTKFIEELKQAIIEEYKKCLIEEIKVQLQSTAKVVVNNMITDMLEDKMVRLSEGLP